MTRVFAEMGGVRGARVNEQARSSHAFRQHCYGFVKAI